MYNSHATYIDEGNVNKRDLGIERVGLKDGSDFIYLTSDSYVSIPLNPSLEGDIERYEGLVYDPSRFRVKDGVVRKNLERLKDSMNRSFGKDIASLAGSLFE